MILKVSLITFEVRYHDALIVLLFLESFDKISGSKFISQHKRYPIRHIMNFKAKPNLSHKYLFLFRYWNQLNEDIRILLQRFDTECGDEVTIYLSNVMIQSVEMR